MYLCVCAGEMVCACHDARVGARGQRMGVSSLPPPVGPGDGTQVVRPGGQHRHSLNHLASPKRAFNLILPALLF